MHEGDLENQVLSFCAARGLDLRAAAMEDGLLALTPGSLDRIPDADTLRILALELKGSFGARWVTLVVETETADD